MDARVLPPVQLSGGVRRIGAVACALLLAAGCRPGPRAEAAGGDRRSPGPGEALAVWPEETPAEVAEAQARLAAGQDPWRADPERTALAFARDVLGWDDARAGGVREQPGGLTLVDVRRGPDGPAVSVRLVRRMDGPWWSVYNAWGSVEHDPLVSVRDGDVEIRFDLEDAARARVVVEYGELRAVRVVEGERPVRIDLGAAPTVPGYFLITLQDPAGRTFDVVSSPLPAGDFTAG